MISLKKLLNFIEESKLKSNTSNTSETKNEKESLPSYENSIKNNSNPSSVNSSKKEECPKCPECPKCSSSSINYNNSLLEKISKLIQNKNLDYSNLSNKLSNRIKKFNKKGTNRSSAGRNIINNSSSSNSKNPSNNNFESLIEKKKLILKELEDIKVKQLKLIDQRLNNNGSKSKSQ
jgi:hypothetical protein